MTLTCKLVNRETLILSWGFNLIFTSDYEKYYNNLYKKELLSVEIYVDQIKHLKICFRGFYGYIYYHNS